MLSSGADDAWYVFNANSGDNLTITLTAATQIHVGALVREVANGLVEVGDAVNRTNFNTNQAGQGVELIVQNPIPPAVGSCGDYRFGAGCGIGAINFAVATTGQYAIVVSANNEVNFGSYNVQLSGNTPIPEPASAMLLSLGLSALALRRRAGR